MNQTKWGTTPTSDGTGGGLLFAGCSESLGLMVLLNRLRRAECDGTAPGEDSTVFQSRKTSAASGWKGCWE